ncbi:hypothetical protein SLS56_010620 [Neofusicoccum ribis]|uniref:Cytochrome P450 n=1 Tax=Neofusicoccum ribis TaxID=45134 RepID=A0ABR3SDX0_9PEZI
MDLDGNVQLIRNITGAGNNYIKGESYVPFKGKRTFDLFGERNERVHGQQRRLVGGGYTMETMKTLEPYVNETVKVLLKKMEDTGTNGRVIEFAYLTHLFAFDVIGEVTFARRFGYIEAGSDFGLFGTIAKTLLSGVWVGEIPWLYHLHQRLVPLIGNHLAINARNGYLHDFTLKQMAARKERAAAGADDHNSDILSKLLAASRAKPQLSESDIGFTLTSNVIAGSDTTAVSMSAIVYYLLVTSAAKDRLLRELREKVVAGDVDADGIVPAAVGEKWPFLQAVIHEGMRMHPALGGLLARVVPPAGLRFGENFVPGGAEVGTSPWVIHRNKDIFGDDVETFRPERWLDEKRKTDMHRFFFGFGGGSRTCVGKNISMLELNKVIPTLFLRFDLQISNDKPGPEEKFYSYVYSAKSMRIEAYVVQEYRWLWADLRGRA